MEKAPYVVGCLLPLREGDPTMEAVIDIQKEVDENYEEFVRLLPTILSQHRDKFALMRQKAVLGYFSTAQDAATAALSFVPDGRFSIQEVTDMAINLGFFTDAVPLDSVQP